MSRIRFMHSPSFLSRESNIHFYEKTLEKNAQERTLCHASFFLRIFMLQLLITSDDIRNLLAYLQKRTYWHKMYFLNMN